MFVGMDAVKPTPLITGVAEDMLYVALGEKVKKNKLLLLWALQNSGGRKICIILVHRPAKAIPIMGVKFPASKMEKKEVDAYREIERKEMKNILDEYCQICREMGVEAETLYTEMDRVEKGILELITKHGISKLVMGAAADKHYSKRMMGLKSKKAIYVRQHAPLSCHIQFICEGRLIYTRQNTTTGSSTSIRSPSEETNISVAPSSSAQVSFCCEGGSRTVISSFDGTEELPIPRRRFDEEGSSDECTESSRRYPPNSGYSTCSSSGALDITRVSSARYEGSVNEQEHGNINDTFHAQLQQAMAEAEKGRREALQEAERHGEAKKDAVETMRRARLSESSSAEELKQRKEIEEALAKERQEHGKVKNQLNQVIQDLQVALDRQSSLGNQISEYEKMVKWLELKTASSVERLQTSIKERDEMRVERDQALKEAEALRNKQEEVSSTDMVQFLSDLPFSEIEEATRNFDPSLKIGEGRHGRVYKGILCQTEAAIKMLHYHNSGFQLQVDALSKLKHPNLVMLIGSCPEAQALIFEYLPNGTLEDRLSCKDNTPPLSWQTRVCIATGLCSALIFLHSSTPFSILHGDLTPAKVLLGANFVSKLRGWCPLSQDQSLNKNITRFWSTERKGITFPYLDPEFLFTGELTLKSDVYSFGIILLQLLTGRPPLGIQKEVQYALDAGTLQSVLDPLAGDWPFEQAEQWAHLALRCCEMYRKNRPHLRSDVWTELKQMMVLGGCTHSSQLGYEGYSEPPPYILCPISQEVMQDPHVAADGFTYEAKSLKEWFDRGHDTSPMTNLRLEHYHLVPNHALRSAIQEWRQRH
ncbi:U-box domain-containing protein 33-like isoform X2 [Juglans microcarpa x Juglans regia]|uniref:U-box domain-containing protein 33-like isoform X2 n=1 Tax=Juglans microcarpa x Juglans regia TaxID=2249226 RepID=UPI001B7ED86B|nr:U-box domain-containing protein 33-like isoform X2 [Juglans microcarpa x Juglans regia]